ncbi:DNA-directed DNA polymerase II large subunit [Halorubrum salsamenti]|uniref:DNA-directed DNA polymerase II large subunit n=1 Tax=Halorubrum salsamenti TaxID=2583990 RepID=UPI0011A8992B|nr:DNA-directed DNA polymerase II large subunit [Halorubrum salsamenti]
MRPDDERYFARIEDRLDEAWDVAEAAKEQGHDPKPEIEIPIARDMADRVENILGIDGVAERVRELEGEMSREEAALELVTDFVEGTVGDYDSRAGKVEGAVRTAVALLTEGVVAAPIEGIDRVELLENDDGTEFVNVYYAGPIRSAGGTAQALSVLVADYARSLLGIDEYKPRDVEVERYAEEIALYDKETGLQYTPKDKESKFIAQHMPVMLDGEATGDEEVSGFRDLERVDTNSARGGMCLVAAEGIALKAPKIQRYTRDLDEVDWPWLQDLIDGTIGKDGGGASDEDAEGADGEGDDGDGGDSEANGDGEGDESDGSGAADDDSGAAELDGPLRAKSSQKFLRDLIAGRPVFTHPSEAGGFRLRYGRARNHGFATGGVHPATMHLVDDFLAAGTQIKTERPGKAHGVVPVDSIEGPTVRLANGEVRRIDDPEEAKEIRNGVEKVLDLGEYLVNYGEFVENNHPLAPASYVYEWWVQEFEAAGADVQAMEDDPHVDLERPEVDEALAWAREYDCPLHPEYTYLWHDVSVDAFEALADAVVAGDVVEGVLAIERTETTQTALESLLVEHAATPDALRIPTWRPLARSLGVDDGLRKGWSADDLSAAARGWDDGENAVKAVNEVAPFEVRERAPTRIGNRMGRPEKSESRDLSPAVHTLFPINEAGGPQRDVAEAASVMDDSGHRGRLEVEVSDRVCPECGEHTYRAQCPDCEVHTDLHYECGDCGTVCEPDEAGRVECPRCEWEVTAATYREVDLNDAYRSALETVGEREASFEILKGVQGLTSRNKTPEPIEKGILRAKNGVTSFKDGTVRYDMTDLPVTSVRPEELDVTADHLREIGYETDIDGEPLRHDDQLVELRVQDIVLSDGAAEHMLKTADFVDDLLEQYYGLDRFYEVNERDDLVGELVFGMAPHTSAATVGRVVGFTSAAVGYAHPYFHAAKRRNCFHPETEIEYRDDAGWHRETIEEFVQDRLDDPATDDFGTLVDELDADVYVRSIDEHGEPTVQPVTAVSKHRSQDHLVEVRTAGGRSIRVTPDHTMLRVDSDGLRDVRASELSAGDDIPCPASADPSSVTGETTALADGGVVTDEISTVEPVASDVDHTYCVTVAETHTLVTNNLYSKQCDGDEDCVMLLMDGLLNFSKTFLPDQRGGRMDAPLVMSSRIDPSEIDDEAHNVDIAREYPREFYDATLEMADPESVEDLIRIGEDTLGTDEEYHGFGHTHDTTDIAMGPDLSAYKTLGDMMEKMDAQLELARKLRAVDETDVAERVIEYHFLPDIIGNLRAFSRQETRCLDCGEKYRRMPLSGDCRECGGRVNLTVHEGSVSKYVDTAIEVADRFGCRPYTKQRLKVLDQSLESIFEDDTNKQSGIADFM